MWKRHISMAVMLLGVASLYCPYSANACPSGGKASGLLRDHPHQVL